MNNIIQDFLDDKIITEVSASTVRYSKKSKRNRFAGKSAMGIAKKMNDPLYKKYKKHRQMALDTKEKIMRKYKRKGMQIARKRMR